MERKALPSEDEQAAVYAELARAFAPHPVVVRTLDIGGDKPVAGIAFPARGQPFPRLARRPDVPRPSPTSSSPSSARCCAPPPRATLR